jgi:hypothetical protein
MAAMNDPPVYISSTLNCGKCHHEVNTAAAVDTQRPPRPGDIAICAYCGAINVYTPQGLKIPVGKELTDILDMIISRSNNPLWVNNLEIMQSFADREKI